MLWHHLSRATRQTSPEPRSAEGPKLAALFLPCSEGSVPPMQLTSVGDGGDRASTKVSPQIIAKGLSNATNNQWSKRNAVRRLPQL